MGGDDKYKNIFYQLCDGEKLVGNVDLVQLSSSELSSGIVGNLRKMIKGESNRLLKEYDSGDLSLYAKGTTIDDYKNQDPLRIGLSLSDDQIQGTTEDNPLLVVLAPTALPASAVNIQQQPLVLSEPVQQGLELMVQDFMARKKTIVMSNVSKGITASILDRMSLPERGASWSGWSSTRATNIVDGFSWELGDEDSKGTRDAYMKYLKRTLRIPPGYGLADTQPNRSLLSVELDDEVGEIVKMSGTTDIAIAKSEHICNHAIRNNIEVLLELKKPKNMSEKDHTPQTVCEHIAASYLNRTHAVVSVLTDLNEEWTFFWFAIDSVDESGMALYKLCLDGKEAATNAKYLLDSIFSDSVVEYLPKSFLERRSFQDVVDCLHTRRKKRAREVGSDGGNPGNQNDDSKPSSSNNGEQHQSPTGSARSGTPPSKSTRLGQDYQVDESQGGESCKSLAESLSLFAPPSSRDVGNELDLLDMVDSNEQYEIVRSFAAKHIIPFMKGSEV